MSVAVTIPKPVSAPSISIRQEDLIQSVADALQYISYYHPVDYIRNLAAAYEREESPAAKDAIAQILINSRMCAEGHRPICQDTGIVTVFLEIGMGVRWDDATMGVEDMVHEGVRRAYNHPDNKLRASVLADPAGKRINTKDNTPGVVNVKVVPGNTVDVIVAAKGGGSEAKSKFAMLNPSDSIVDWVLKTVPTMGAGWCPPGMLGIGIGGTAEKAMLLAKEALMEPIDITDLQARGASNRAEELRLELFDKVNALGIGAQGLGGLTTVLDIKVKDYPTHAANLPVALIPNCAATRHAHFTLDGSGPVMLDPPSLEDWPRLTYDASKVAASTSIRSPRPMSPAGSRAKCCCSTASCSPAATPRTSGSWRCSTRAKHCRSISRGASSITSARSIRCATKSSGRPAPPRRRAWTSSRSRC